jgi:acetate kinase
MLNKQSGLLGISQMGSDMRTIEEAAINGNESAILAETIFAYRLAKYIMALTVPLGRLDALVFTGGIGENGPRVRKIVLNMLGILGFKIDDAKNNEAFRGKSGIITQEDSPVAIVVPTNEEWIIAQDALKYSQEV